MHCWEQLRAQLGAKPVHVMRSASLCHRSGVWLYILVQLDQKLPEGKMANHDLLFDFWRNILAENLPSDRRDIGICVEGKTALCDLLATFLVKNEFTKVEQLKRADHPSEWTGSGAFSQDELELVWSLRNVARRRSRLMHICNAIP